MLGVIDLAHDTFVVQKNSALDYISGMFEVVFYVHTNLEDRARDRLGVFGRRSAPLSSSVSCKDVPLTLMWTLSQGIAGFFMLSAVFASKTGSSHHGSRRVVWLCAVFWVGVRSKHVERPRLRIL